MTPPLPTSNTFINEDNARWFGGTMDSVWCGKHGAVMPAGIELPTEHENLGWLGSDGITKSHNDEVAEWTGHQGGRTIRKKVTSSEDTFQFLAAETKLIVMGLLNNIAEHVTKNDSVDSGEYHSMKVTGSKRSNDKRSWIVDLWDGEPGQEGTIWYRYLIPSGEIGERPDETFSTESGTEYEMTVTIYGDYYILTNDPSMAPEAAEVPEG